MVDLSNYYFYEIKHTKNQEDWHFNITVKQRNKILFNDEVTVIPDRGQEHFLTKDNKSFTLDCIWFYDSTELIPHTRNVLLMNIRIPFIVLYNKIEASYEVYFYNEKNPYYEMDYPNCYINKDNRILLINL